MALQQLQCPFAEEPDSAAWLGDKIWVDLIAWLLRNFNMNMYESLQRKAQGNTEPSREQRAFSNPNHCFAPSFPGSHFLNLPRKLCANVVCLHVFSGSPRLVAYVLTEMASLLGLCASDSKLISVRNPLSNLFRDSDLRVRANQNLGLRPISFGTFLCYVWTQQTQDR